MRDAAPFLRACVMSRANAGTSKAIGGCSASARRSRCPPRHNNDQTEIIVRSILKDCQWCRFATPLRKSGAVPRATQKNERKNERTGVPVFSPIRPRCARTYPPWVRALYASPRDADAQTTQ